MHSWFIHVCTYVYMDIAPHCSSGKGSSRRWEERLQQRTKSRPRVIPRCPNYTGAEGLDQPAARFWEKRKKSTAHSLCASAEHDLSGKPQVKDQADDQRCRKLLRKSLRRASYKFTLLGRMNVTIFIPTPHMIVGVLMYSFQNYGTL